MARPFLKAAKLDLSNPDENRAIRNTIRGLKGAYKVSLIPTGPIRSIDANNYYFGFVVTPYFNFLRAQDWDVLDVEEAHKLLKQRLLPEPPPLIDPETGEAVLNRERETHAMTGEEFWDYVERTRAYLWETFEIETKDPDPTLSKRFQKLQNV
jgi:hypothetical protein